MPAIVQGEFRRKAQVAVLLTHVERSESRGTHQVGDADTGGMRFGDQRDDTTGRLRRSPMVVRTLPEASRPAANARGPALDMGKVGLVDQRAIAEQPHLRVAVEVGRAAVDLDCVGALGRCVHRWA